MNPCIYRSPAPVLRGLQSLLNDCTGGIFAITSVGSILQRKKTDKTDYHTENSRENSILREHSPDTARKLMNQSSQEQTGDCHILSMPFILHQALQHFTLHLLVITHPKVFRVVPEIQQLLYDCFPIFLPLTLAEDYL